MKTLVVYAHPYEKSFNHEVCQRVCQNKKNVQLIDLYQDGFNPCYTKEELALFVEGKTLDPLVEKYQRDIENCSELIFICPIWWNDVPAILKGFMDKVMKKKFAYVDTKTGVTGKLQHIQQATIITTSTSPTWYLRFFAGNGIQSVFLNASLKQMGIKNRKWLNCGMISQKNSDARIKFLNSLANI